MLVKWPYHLPGVDGAPEAPPLLRLSGITKRFLDVLALEDVSFELQRGEVHALCGENGAGKSTLMKILSGQLLPDAGEITFKGTPVRFASTTQAQAAGIAMIHQELNLVPHLSVAENIFLAREPRRGPFIDRRRLHSDAQRCLDRLGVDITPAAIVRTLSVAQLTRDAGMSVGSFYSRFEDKDAWFAELLRVTGEQALQDTQALLVSARFTRASNVSPFW